MTTLADTHARPSALGSRVALIALTVSAVFIILAIAVPWVLAPGDPTAIAPADAFAPPSFTHPFGTDESGRDVLTRVVHGAAASAGIGLAATALGLGIGIVLGVIASIGPRFVDTIVSRLTEVLFALPTLVMALLLIAVIGRGWVASVIAIGIATAPGYARIVRARVRQVIASGYVQQARTERVHPIVIAWRHVLPNTLWPLVSVATLGVGQAIVWVAALGFLGLGELPPSPEWGALLNAGRVYIGSAWWLTVAPGFAIVFTAAVLTMIGRRTGKRATA